MRNKTFWLLFAIAFIMRLLMIWRAPLWYDENFTLLLARMPFDEMIQATAGDVHPPLWYIIEWLFYRIDPTQPVWTIRLPAFVFSMFAFLMFVKLCDELRIPERVKVAAVFLMAVMPMQLWYAQEGRMYALLELLVLASLYTGLTRKWFSFALISIAMMYTQNYGLFYLAVIGMVLIVLDWWTTLNVMITAAVTLLAYTPWAMVVTSQMADIEGRYWIMSAGAGSVLGAIYKQFFASAMLEAGLTSSYVVVFAALIIGVYALMSEKVESWWVVLTMAFAPVSLAWIASMLWQPLLLFRPLIGISPFLYLIVCWPMEHIFYTGNVLNIRRALYASCFIVPVLMLGIGGYYLNIGAMKGEGETSPMLASLDYVRANWHEGDVIFYTDDGPMINLMPYTDLPQYRMPACDQPVMGSLSTATRAAFGISVMELSDVPHTRAWIYAPRSPLHPQCYERQIASFAPVGGQILTVDDNEYITSGVWLAEK